MHLEPDRPFSAWLPLGHQLSTRTFQPIAQGLSVGQFTCHFGASSHEMLHARIRFLSVARRPIAAKPLVPRRAACHAKVPSMRALAGQSVCGTKYKYTGRSEKINTVAWALSPRRIRLECCVSFRELKGSQARPMHPLEGLCAPGHAKLRH
jgi:hypothetical protein